jgi:aminoglycoside phosphotransferase (APT) family kinase protein
VDLPGGDLVDFNTRNVLLHQDAVSAVIDVGELGSGTRVIDYGRLLREAYVQDYDPEGGEGSAELARRWPGLACWRSALPLPRSSLWGFKLRHEPAVVMATMNALQLMAGDLTDPRSDAG